MNVIAIGTQPAATAALRQLGQLLARTAAIMLAAGVIILGATALGYSPLGSELPRAFLSFGEQHQAAAPPGGANPAAGARSSPGGSTPGQAASSGGLLTGRNAPSLKSGLPQELPDVAIFVGLTAASAGALSLSSWRRRRRPPQLPRRPLPI